ncbi:TetR/AcrR family transcriptional regulator [Sporomusa malonica]|uniref:Transcriptional regulator, TetR family n=1 Tax=Sporomusa malonica TaxID=112901 RepID=A0A1W2ECS3_9FIRM|nr:TetR/AcrR family transcriptional regulator [Sporomusa malonica]SMD07485.1 transcriptional regulator, TetR family [Sporomusa malonica]
MTKENIIIAALRLFLMRGYKSVSLIDVAHEVGITKGGIYHYFSSKDDLLHTAIQFLLELFERNFKELLKQKTLAEILHLLLVENSFEAYSKELLGVDNTCSLDHVHFAIEIMRLYPDIQERIQQNNVLICESLAARIQEAVDKGELKPSIDSYALSLAILAMLNGQKSLGMRFQTVEMRKRMLDNVWRLISN